MSSTAMATAPPDLSSSIALIPVSPSTFEVLAGEYSRDKILSSPHALLFSSRDQALEYLRLQYDTSLPAYLTHIDSDYNTVTVRHIPFVRDPYALTPEILAAHFSHSKHLHFRTESAAKNALSLLPGLVLYTRPLFPPLFTVRYDPRTKKRKHLYSLAKERRLRKEAIEAGDYPISDMLSLLCALTSAWKDSNHGPLSLDTSYLTHTRSAGWGRGATTANDVRSSHLKYLRRLASALSTLRRPVSFLSFSSGPRSDFLSAYTSLRPYIPHLGCPLSISFLRRVHRHVRTLSRKATNG